MWYSCFGKLLICPPKKVVIIDTLGGSGKSTLAKEISKRYGHNYIENDDCKYGENWVRFSDDEYEKNINEKVALSDNGWVVASTYHDPRLPKQREVINSLIEQADLVIWQDYPLLIVLWRKLFRSFKRAIGAVEQGTSVEKFSNVVAMAKKTYNQFHDRRLILDLEWKRVEMNTRPTKFSRLLWPFYYEVN